MSDKQLLFKVYMNKDEMDCGFYVENLENIKNNIDSWREENEQFGIDFPVFEPVFMTIEEYEALPEFSGF